jgi:hypothetical protein
MGAMSRFIQPAGSYQAAASVTSGDSADLPGGVASGLLCVGTGNISFVTPNGTIVALTSVAANTVLPIAVVRVRASTTGTWVALY